MGDPPDGSSSPSLKWDKTKTKTFTTSGPKYLIMTRINSDQDLKNVSPFLIKKAIDITCADQIDECKKMRNGNILIKTKNSTQASKLLTLTSLSNSIDIDISEHKTLNNSKGVIYCNELRGISEEEILSELKQQFVIEVKKFMNNTNDTLSESGLICLTFSSSTLPTTINVGYLKVNVRAYIPQPTRCNNCFNYGHIGKFCTLPKLCYNCSNAHHLSEKITTCFLSPKCLNCKKLDLPSNDHSPTSKSCPIFIKQKELQAIKTTYKVDNRTALNIYDERHQHNMKSFSSVLKTQNNYTNPQHIHSSNLQSTLNTHQTTDPPPVPIRSLVNYSDLNDIVSLPKSSSKNIASNITKTKNNVKIYPAHMSKRLQTQLKSLVIYNITQYSHSESLKRSFEKLTNLRAKVHR